MEFTDLPAVVQSRVLNLAARSLTGAAALQIPRELVAVARFAPARRARRGAVPLARALESDPAFRALVAHRAAGLDPHGVLMSLGAGTAPADAEVGVPDAVTADANELDSDDSSDNGAAPTVGPDAARVSDIDLLALAYLRAAAAPPGVFERLRTAEETGELRTRLLAAEAELVKLRAAAERNPAGRGTPTEVAGSPDDDAGPAARIERLTTRLREQGSRLREALDAVAHLQQEKDAHAREAARALEIMTRGRTAAEQRAAALATQVSALQAGEEAAAARQEYRERVLTRRVELLLETATGAIEGLRSEWTPDSGGRRPGGPSGPAAAPVDPADVVARRLVRPSTPRLPEIADTARLAEALGLPRAHLIVDGYNVSKNGFGHLTLAEQRERLIRTLAAFAARSGAEVTVVFDGAAVVAPAGHQRGVRVLFSPEGTIADDVIRDLVDAEPTGRPVVVVTSDRAVMTDVGAAGARVARSEVLLAALGR